MPLASRSRRFPVPRFLAVVVGVLLSFSAFASAAQACSYPDASQVFSQWGDSDYYQLAPDGGLEEGGSDWRLRGGASVVSGNESYYLNGPADQYSLSIPFGGTATSPRICVDSSTPTFRLMARNGGDSDSRLLVTEIFWSGWRLKVRSTVVHAGAEWAPTQQLQLDTDDQVEHGARLNFTPLDNRGEWQLDDLYIDPFSRR